ncbi:hypothetical protein ACFX5L_02155 [Bacteroides sp. KG123]|uniref:fimbrial tip adhesin FimD n=1 Tax=unclassified Bacteroides TaxID=2646097 RepID=UPI003D7FC0B1
MRAIYYTVFFILVILFAGSCITEPYDDSPDGGEGYLTLRLNNMGLVTRAVVEAGEDNLNENKIQTVDCFFYPEGKTNEAAVFSAIKLDVNQNGTAEIRLKLPVEKKSVLFGSGSTCRAYVIANRPEATAIGAQTDVNSLKGLSIVADGFTTNTDGGVQKSFVMDGSAVVTLAANGKSATGDVPLYRAASKIRLNVSVKDKVVDDSGAEWTSHPEKMFILIQNGVKKANIDVATVPYAVTEADYFSFDDENNPRLLTPVSGGASNLYSHVPFYSYTSTWASSFDNHSPMIKVVIPWQKRGETSFQRCYYKLPVNETGMKLDRNTYYKINLSVGMLGSFVPETAIELNPSYIILDWGTGEVKAEMQDLRYLTVGFSKLVMENQNTVSIPYASSHDCEIVNVTVTHPNLTTEISTTETLINNQTNAGGVYYDDKDNSRPYTFELSKNSITFTHNLKNRSGDYDQSNFDYTPYGITFTIRHKDNHNYSEQVSITQYPMMYIEAFLNSVYRGQGLYNNAHNGFVMVNNGQSIATDYTYYDDVPYTLGSVVGLTGGNQNPNMYVITTTALQGTTSYTIGDPRSNAVDNLRPTLYDTYSNWSVNASSLYGGYSRNLTYYYPAEENQRTVNMIAPKFRIASSYGVTKAIVRENAKARCASYQEDGFPAGRWRVPTTAEVRYIIDLSAQGKIPRLFGDETGRRYPYWSANGLVYVEGNYVFVSSNPSSGITAHVRCVYDEWYWGSETIINKKTFTWGDRPR